MLKPYFEEGVLGRAIKLKKIIDVKIYDLREFTADKHRTADERPFGGGPGMVIKALPVLKAVDKALKQKAQSKKRKAKIIILSPRGKKFDDKMAGRLAKGYTDIVLISGRYEGMDSRAKRAFKSEARNSKLKISVEEVSVGDYVLSGGELAAGIVADAVARKVPGVLGNRESLEEGRISSGEMYTRPEVLEWKGKKYKVPKVLISGHHKKIEEWRKKKK